MSFSRDCFSTQQGSLITSCESWFLCKYLTKCQCTVLSVHLPCRDFLQPTQPCQYLSPTMSRAIRARGVILLIILPQADANSCFVRFCTLTAQCTSLATNEPRTKCTATFRKFLNCCYAAVMENDDELLKI